MPEASAAKTGPVISVRDVVVSYNGRRVLDGINLDIARGETMVLLGGSGSGKARSCARSSAWSVRNPARFSSTAPISRVADRRI